MLKVLGSVLGILTMAVGGLGAISLLVGGVSIVITMTIAVNEGTTEIGLLRAIGGDSYQILLLFIGEAVVLAGIGGLFGLAIGADIAWFLGELVPALPTYTPAAPCRLWRLCRAYGWQELDCWPVFCRLAILPGSIQWMPYALSKKGITE